MRIGLCSIIFILFTFSAFSEPECVNLAKEIDIKMKKTELTKEKKKEIISMRNNGLMAMPTGKEACLSILNETLNMFWYQPY